MASRVFLWAIAGHASAGAFGMRLRRAGPKWSVETSRRMHTGFALQQNFTKTVFLKAGAQGSTLYFIGLQTKLIYNPSNMSLGTSARKPIHTRSITMNSYLREDALWEVEAHLVDVKAYDFPTSRGAMHLAGDPVHDMTIVLLVTADGLITDVRAKYESAPYDAACMAIEDAYRGLIGLHLLRQFRAAVRERFGTIDGCTHMSELVVLLPTVFVQSLSAQRRERAQQAGKKPFQLDGCHALALTSPVVKEHYPQWYVKPEDGGKRKTRQGSHFRVTGIK